MKREPLVLLAKVSFFIESGFQSAILPAATSFLSLKRIPSSAASPDAGFTLFDTNMLLCDISFYENDNRNTGYDVP